MTDQERKVIYDEIVKLRGEEFISHYRKGNISYWTFGYSEGPRLITGDGGAELMLNTIKVQDNANS